MTWQELCVPIGYTPLAQIIVSFVLGLIFSYFSMGLAIIVFFLVIYDSFCYALAAGYDYRRWFLMARVGVIFAYVAGWLIARALLGLDSVYINKDKDEKTGLKLNSCH